ncbi:hypothetical protein D1007_35652 [Hordeum vulgare]|nr:hypothetical protein D1007_35652 [Hordeum vulgare]
MGSSSRSGLGEEAELEEMLKNMELLDEDLDDVVIGKDQAKRFKEDARWLAIARVNTDMSFSSSSLFDTMKFVWGLAQTPKFREAVVIEDYDGKTDPEEYALDGVFLWAQIHKVPDLYRHPEVVDELARRIVKVREVQLRPTLYYEGDYVRVRVTVLTAKPLTRFTPLNVKGEGRKMLVVKYDKVPFFYKICGIMGHGFEECGNGIWEEKDKKWGSWMLAKCRTVSYAQPADGRSFFRGGRGMGGARGRGREMNQGRGGTESNRGPVRGNEQPMADEQGDGTEVLKDGLDSAENRADNKRISAKNSQSEVGSVDASEKRVEAGAIIPLHKSPPVACWADPLRLARGHQQRETGAYRAE